MTAQGPRTRQGHLGTNISPIVSPEAWEAAHQKMLAKEKAAVDALAAEPRRMPGMAVENHLRTFPPGPLPDQTEFLGLHAGAAPGYRVRDTRAGHSRALPRFLIVLCGGVAATLAWWSYGDAARRMIASSYPQFRWWDPPPALTAPEAPDIAPYPNQLDATLREPRAMRQSPERIVAGQGPTRNTDQTTTTADQAPSAQADRIPVESRGGAASLQPGAPLNIKSTEAKALQTLSEKGKQVSAANQYDTSCLPSASAVLRNHPGARPSWTLRAPGHEGTQCWYAAERPRGR